MDSGAGDGYNMYQEDSSSSEEDSTEYPQMNPDLSVPGAIKQMFNVLVTGFGPFSDHSVNASWEAVKALKKIGITHNVNLIIEEIPVSYEAVQKRIPELWESFDPVLTVHVGVSSQASELTIETLAHNTGYSKPDVNHKVNHSKCCVKNGMECLKTGLDISAICSEVNHGPCLIMAVSSCDAGRYLCEYIYYTSLNISSDKTVFIHVPVLDKPYKAHEIAEGIRMAIIDILKQKNLYHPLQLPNSQNILSLANAQ